MRLKPFMMTVCTLFAIACSSPKPDMNKPGSRSLRFLVGAHSDIGLHRPTMEDEHYYSVDDDILSAHVFDGHGGRGIAKALVGKHSLDDAIRKKLAQGADAREALMEAYAETDEAMKKDFSKNLTVGSTAVTALVKGLTLTVANAGDSEAIVVLHDGSTINMTFAHTATDASEKKRIEDVGGVISMGRVGGSLAVSRAFGDFIYKVPQTKNDWVLALPFIKTIELEPAYEYLVLACDGLWDVFTHDQVGQLVEKKSKNGLVPTAIAKFLVEEALRMGSTDNVSVIVIKILS